jgi:hypothetical protein
MFCLIYICNSILKPQVLEISKNKPYLLTKIKEKAFQQCIDNIGRNNYIDTLNEQNLENVSYPVYPTMTLKKLSDTEIQVVAIEKTQILEKGYIYNSTKEVLEVKPQGTYYVLDIENWKYDELPERPKEEQIMICKSEKSIQTDQVVTRNYDKVILQLVEAIQKRKID